MKQFESKYGHFSDDGFEYIINRHDTPTPWTNVISNSDYGLIVSQAGGGFSWRTHVSLNRLTRWNQDLIRDDWGKWLYLRDRDTGALRSFAFQPVQAGYDAYQVRHGLGYTTFFQRIHDLETEWTLFATKDDPVEIWMCTVRNIGRETRRLQLASYLEWCLGAAPDNHREFHKLFIETEHDPGLRAIQATKSIWEVPTDRGHWNTEWPYLAFHALNREVSGWDASKESLIGRLGSFQNPAGIRQGNFTATKGRFQDAAASLATDIDLQAEEEQTTIFLLGQVEHNDRKSGHEQIKIMIERYASEKAARSALEQVKTFWRELTGHASISSPDGAFDLLANIWLKYQAISGHLWARTGYFQQSGAYGFRDQLQTSQVWLLHEPARMLQQIRLNATHQLKNGTVHHWWHPLSEVGHKTDMTDDLLWLPYMLARYFDETADFSPLAEMVPFFDENEATLQEHCTKAIDVVLGRFSERGLPLIGAGDWCDGFSAVGLDWQGESIWLGMFLYDILNRWAAILERYSAMPDHRVAKKYRGRAQALKEAVNTHGWNGQWYIAATKDDGTPIGDPSQEECKIYLNAQTWAILSGIADGERRQMVTKAFLDHLECENGCQLFRPAFTKPDKNIGYITRYAPSVRENGGVYTHAATWSVLALAMQKMPDAAMRIFRKLNPILQSQKKPDRYQAEPYVLPGNIDGKDSEYCGRAGWSWYTGSAGWLLTIAHEAICGVQAVVEGLKIDPCMPAEWPRLQVVRNFRGARYEITIENPNGFSGGVEEIFINGEKMPGNMIPPQKSGVHEVRVVLTGNEENEG